MNSTQQRFSAMLADGVNIKNKSLISNISVRRNTIQQKNIFLLWFSNRLLFQADRT